MSHKGEAFEIDFNGPSRKPPPKLSSSLPLSGVNVSVSRPAISSSASKLFNIDQPIKVKKPVGQPGYVDGVVVCKNDNGTYDVKYNDGSIENGVASSRMVAKDDVSIKKESKQQEDSAVGHSYKVGSRVVYTDSSSSPLEGRVVSCNKNGSFDILLSNGKEIRGVMESQLVPSDPKVLGIGAEATPLSVGDRVEVRKNNGVRWCLATITNKRPLDNYDVIYDDDNTKELRVPRKCIRPQAATEMHSELQLNDASKEVNPGEGSRVLNTAIVEGAKVEANYRGKGKYYPGRVKRDRGDGTFDIDYDDGELELQVDRSLVRGWGVLQDSISASKEVEVAAMENALVSLLEKSLSMAEQLRLLSDEVVHMKSREADMMALITAQDNMLATLMKK